MPTTAPMPLVIGAGFVADSVVGISHPMTEMTATSAMRTAVTIATTGADETRAVTAAATLRRNPAAAAEARATAALARPTVMPASAAVT